MDLSRPTPRPAVAIALGLALCVPAQRADAQVDVEVFGRRPVVEVGMGGGLCIDATDGDADVPPDGCASGFVTSLGLGMRFPLDAFDWTDHAWQTVVVPFLYATSLQSGDGQLLSAEVALEFDPVALSLGVLAGASIDQDGDPGYVVGVRSKVAAGVVVVRLVHSRKADFLTVGTDVLILIRLIREL